MNSMRNRALCLLLIATMVVVFGSELTIADSYQPPQYVDLSTTHDLQIPISDENSSHEQGGDQQSPGVGSSSTSHGVNKSQTKRRPRSNPHPDSPSPTSRRTVSSGSISDNFSENKNLFPPICGCTSCRVSSNFGPRKDPVYGGSAVHYGCDIAAARGTNVYAAADGEVLDMVGSYSPPGTGSRGKQSGYGNQVILRHRTPEGKTYLTRVGHLEKVLVSKGQKVKKGDVIATVDSTGKSTGHHLHFEVMKCKGDGGEKDDSCEKKDPSLFFDIKKVTEACENPTLENDNGSGNSTTQ